MSLATTKRLSWALAALVLTGISASRADAGQITGTFYQGDLVDGNNATSAGPTAAGLAQTIQTLMFNSTALSYNAGANQPDTLGNFLGGDAPAGHRNDVISNSDPATRGSYFLFTGSIFLTAGNHTLTLRHDDGAQFSFTMLGLTFGSSGPTSAKTDTGTVNVTTAGEYDFRLGYGEVQGPPAVLRLTLDGDIVRGVPEPSTMVGASIALMFGGGIAWRRRRQVAV